MAFFSIGGSDFVEIFAGVGASRVRELFAEQGQVLSVRLMKDKATGKRRGFGFVEMPVADAAKAIAALNDKEYQQRTLKVREANDKRDRDEKDVNDVDA